MSTKFYFAFYVELCTIILVHGTIVPKWNSLVKNRAKEQTAKNNMQIKRSKSTWEQSCQCHFGTIVTVSLGNNSANLTWEQLYLCPLGAIVPVSLGNNRAALTWEQSCQFCMGTIVPVSFGHKFTSATCEQ